MKGGESSARKSSTINDGRRSPFVDELKKELNLRSEVAQGRRTPDLQKLKGDKNEVF